MIPAKTGWQVLKNRKVMVQMLREVWKGTYRMSFLTTIISIVGLFYLVDPFDLIPDYILFIGWVDDATMLFLLLRRLSVETQRYTRFKVMERKGDLK